MTSSDASSPAPEPNGPDASEEAPAARDDRLVVLESRLKEAEAQAHEFKERFQRLAADFDNHRKRARREAEEAGERAREDLLATLLTVADNFDRAFEAGGDGDALYDGMKLIYRQFTDLLTNSGLERIDAAGHPFDPLLHEAVMREETSAYAEGVVIQEFERGYRYRGKVLRPAKVKVAATPPAPGHPEAPEDVGEEAPVEPEATPDPEAEPPEDGMPEAEPPEDGMPEAEPPEDGTTGEEPLEDGTPRPGEAPGEPEPEAESPGAPEEAPAGDEDAPEEVP